MKPQVEKRLHPNITSAQSLDAQLSHAFAYTHAARSFRACRFAARSFTRRMHSHRHTWSPSANSVRGSAGSGEQAARLAVQRCLGGFVAHQTEAMRAVDPQRRQRDAVTP